MIGFIDSGIGGLTILKAANLKLPYEQFIYLADNLNAPYGELTIYALQKILFHNVKVLVALGCKIIVLACNTATATTISFLRSSFKNIVFIGTEPNIKKPISLGYKNILVLATTATIKNSVLIQKYINTKQINVFPAVNLSKIIEDNITDKKKLELAVAKYFKTAKLNYNNNDAIVLGCTHYPIIKKQIMKIFNCNNIFLSTDGVVKNLIVQVRAQAVLLREQATSLRRQTVQSNEQAVLSSGQKRQRKRGLNKPQHIRLILTKFETNEFYKMVDYLESK